MDRVESMIMDYARAKGGWFTVQDLREGPFKDEEERVHKRLSKKCRSLMLYHFLDRRPAPDNSFRWQYRDAEVEDA